MSKPQKFSKWHDKPLGKIIKAKKGRRKLPVPEELTASPYVKPLI